MFKTILVGLDGSDCADKALLTACDLAEKYGAKLHIINVPKDETATLVSGGYGAYAALAVSPRETNYLEVGQKVVDTAFGVAAKAGCADAVTKVKIGLPSQIILSYAEEISADLIVTGRRGLGGIASLILGSTSQKIAQKARCACLSAV